MTAKRWIPAFASGALVVVVASMGTSTAQVAETHAMKGPSTKVSKAVAVLHATKKGTKEAGKVTFTLTDNGIHVVAELSGLTPGQHGFHIHEFGDSGSDDGMATGKHFNPLGAPHGAPTAGKRHVGDLGNIEADANGRATLDVVDPALAFFGHNSIIGRGIVVHAKADDYKGDAGNAGDRVAVGTIGIARPPATEGMPK